MNSLVELYFAKLAECHGKILTAAPNQTRDGMSYALYASW